MIRQIPFMLAEKNVKFSMNRLVLKGKGKWPIAFQDPRFAAYIRAYETALDNALEQAIEGKMTKTAIAAVEAAVEDLAQAERRVPTESRHAISRGQATAGGARPLGGALQAPPGRARDRGDRSVLGDHRSTT